MKDRKMVKMLSDLLSNESGASSIEYALIASLISIVIIGGATILGTTLQATFKSVAAFLG